MYTNWQQKELIPRSVRRGLLMLIRRDPVKRECMDNFRIILLIDTVLKTLAKVLATILMRITCGMIEEAQTCAVPSRNIQYNLHLLRYIL